MDVGNEPTMDVIVRLVSIGTSISRLMVTNDAITEASGDNLRSENGTSIRLGRLFEEVVKEHCKNNWIWNFKLIMFKTVACISPCFDDVPTTSVEIGYGKGRQAYQEIKERTGFPAWPVCNTGIEYKCPTWTPVKKLYASDYLRRLSQSRKWNQADYLCP